MQRDMSRPPFSLQPSGIRPWFGGLCCATSWLFVTAVNDSFGCKHEPIFLHLQPAD